MSAAQAEAFERCVRAGGVVLFGADTVYGLACDPDDAAAVRRLYALKGRAPEKAAAVMLFSLDRALATLPEIQLRTADALRTLLPGPLTVLLQNPQRRFPLACAGDPETLGLRAPIVPALEGVACAVLQSSANLAGGPEAWRLDGVPDSIRSRVDLQLDAGELPGVASTVVDLRGYETAGEWSVVREGAVGAPELAAALG